ncbi:MAG TPA: hypothetical protein PLP19_22155 [bacterium]|nr:hypothetical protein [bacterium]HPN46204.1 hypothetical protein [bacterium]
MNRQIAIRFVQQSGTVDFYTEEIPDAEVQLLRHYQAQNNEKTQPVIRSEGEDWAVLQVNILEAAADTGAKIAALLNDKNEKTVYYAMLHDPDKSLTAFLLPEQVEFYHYHDDALAEHVHRLTFMECE